MENNTLSEENIQKLLSEIKNSPEFAVSEELYPKTADYIKSNEKLELDLLFKHVKYDIVVKIFKEARMLRENAVDYFNSIKSLSGSVFDINNNFKELKTHIQTSNLLFYYELASIEKIPDETVVKEYLEKLYISLQK